MAFLITVPHSGEKIAPETPWLEGLPEPTLMRDLDRFVDRLYEPAIKKWQIDNIQTEWHRYVVDLNRLPEDIDQDSVVGAEKLSGSEPKGFHWSITTQKEVLMPQPMSFEAHQAIKEKYYDSFHSAVKSYIDDQSKPVYHLDAHSMPSLGTSLHPDPGETRAEIVLGDVHGKSCSEAYRALVEKAYKEAGFQVVMNWPYKGGRITQRYGKPEEGVHTIQVEMNRALYMNEETKQLVPENAEKVSQQILTAIAVIREGLSELD